MPTGLDAHDFLALMLYERYHWSADQVENTPAHHMAYIPIVWAAIAEIQKDN